jgi:hypothetical protein
MRMYKQKIQPKTFHIEDTRAVKYDAEVNRQYLTHKRNGYKNSIKTGIIQRKPKYLKCNGIENLFS